MWQDERHQKIRSHLKTYGRLSIDQFVEEAKVSRETVRRDLLELELAGILRRVRGGAVPLTKEDTDYKVRVMQRLNEKRAIAQAALSLIDNGMTIFIDAGTTTTVMAEVLSTHFALDNLTFLTNSIEVAQLLSPTDGSTQHRYRVHLLSGDVKQQPLETWGAATINDITRFRADIALLAPWGIDAEHGAMNYFIHGAEIARAMAHHSMQTVVLADHSKIGAPARSVFCKAEEISHLVVDNAATGISAFAPLAEVVGNVIIAP